MVNGLKLVGKHETRDTAETDDLKAMRGQAALLILPDIQWHRQAKGKLLAREEGRHQDASKSGADGISGIYNRSRPKSKVRQRSSSW